MKNQKLKVKKIDLLHELPCYVELNIFEASKAFGWFGWYARSYKVEIVDSKDPLARLEASKSSIEDLFKDLLDEIKGFKYQITVKASLIKHKGNADIKSALVYFNSIIKIVIDFKYMLDKSF